MVKEKIYEDKGIAANRFCCFIKRRQKKIMIFGVKQTDAENRIEYDYMGVIYPEGNLGKEAIWKNYLK